MTIRKWMLTTFVLALEGGGVHAQEIEPRAYSNAPVGINFLAVGYAYAEGGLAVDASVHLENANLQVHTTVLAYTRTLDLWGRSGKVNVLVPYAWLSGDAEYAGQPVSREVSGFGAPRLWLAMNFIGAPALSMQEFAAYQQDLIVGASLQLGLPTGQYDADRLINIGSNRWFIKARTRRLQGVGSVDAGTLDCGDDLRRQRGLLRDALQEKHGNAAVQWGITSVLRERIRADDDGYHLHSPVYEL